MMRIEYKGTPLESVLKLNESRPVDFVYLNPEEFKLWEQEARDNGTLGKSSEHWFTVKDFEIVFYLV